MVLLSDEIIKSTWSENIHFSIFVKLNVYNFGGGFFFDKFRRYRDTPHRIVANHERTERSARQREMPATATMIGAFLGLGTQMYSNALRKLPYMRRMSSQPDPNSSRYTISNSTFENFLPIKSTAWLGHMFNVHVFGVFYIQIHGSMCWVWV